MKRKIETLTFALASILGLALQAVHCNAASTTYRFTGTVTDSASLPFPFTSDLNVVPGLEVAIGDPVSGILEIKASAGVLRFPPEIYGPGTGTYGYLKSDTTQLVTINGKELSNGTAVTYVNILDNLEANGSMPLEAALLAETGDAFLLHASSQGSTAVLLDGEDILKDDWVDLTLNFTDSTGTVFQSPGYSEKLDANQFDIRKGFITPAAQGSSNLDRHSGIVFDIATLEQIDENTDTDPTPPVVTPATPVPAVSTGFHVSWPKDAEGYVLELSAAADGPWVPSEGEPVVIDDEKVVIMDLQDRSKFYRLTKTN